MIIKSLLLPYRNNILNMLKLSPIRVQNAGNVNRSAKLNEGIQYLDTIPNNNIPVMVLLKIRNYYYNLNESERLIYAEYIFNKFFRKDNMDYYLTLSREEFLVKYNNSNNNNKMQIKNYLINKKIYITDILNII